MGGKDPLTAEDDWFRVFLKKRLASSFLETSLVNTIPAVPLKLRISNAPLFGLRQALGTYAACTEAPTGKCFGVLQLGRDGIAGRSPARLPPSPALYQAKLPIRLRHRFFIRLPLYYPEKIEMSIDEKQIF